MKQEITRQMQDLIQLVKSNKGINECFWFAEIIRQKQHHAVETLSLHLPGKKSLEIKNHSLHRWNSQRATFTAPKGVKRAFMMMDGGANRDSWRSAEASLGGTWSGQTQTAALRCTSCSHTAGTHIWSHRHLQGTKQQGDQCSTTRGETRKLLLNLIR